MPDESLQDLMALPADRAAAIAGVSPRRLYYWAITGIVEPHIRRRLGLRNQVRLYDFQDMISLLVASQLRERNFSLQAIRKVVEHLQARGYQAPLRELRFATAGKEIYFQHPDGSWEGGARPDQLVIHQVINLDTIRAMIREGVRRPSSSHGRTERRRGTVGSKEVFAGTRIPVAAVRQWLDQGYSAEQVIEQYPDLVFADIERARHYAVIA